MKFLCERKLKLHNKGYKCRGLLLFYGDNRSDLWCLYVQVWKNDTYVRSAQVHGGAIFSAAVQGKWLFTGGWDKTINIQVFFFQKCSVLMIFASEIGLTDDRNNVSATTTVLLKPIFFFESVSLSDVIRNCLVLKMNIT